MVISPILSSRTELDDDVVDDDVTSLSALDVVEIKVISPIPVAAAGRFTLSTSISRSLHEIDRKSSSSTPS